MAGRKAKLKYANAPTVTLNNKYNFTKDVTYNGDLEVDPAKLAVTGGVPTYLNYDWNLESDVDIPGDLDVTGDINFVAAQTFEKECTFQEGIVVDDGAEITVGNVVVTLGSVEATAGSITAGDVIATTTLVATTGNITATTGNITAPLGAISAATVTAGTGFNVAAGGMTLGAGAGDLNARDDIEAVAGNIVATLGAVEATAGTVTGTGGLRTTTGGMMLDNGDLEVVAGNLDVTLGDVDVTAGAIVGGSTITAGTGLGVIDSLAVTHAITALAGGHLEWDGVQVTNGGFIRTLYTANVDIVAAAGTVTILEAALALDTIVTVDAILNGYVSGEVANLNIGDSYTIRVYGAYSNVGGVLTALTGGVAAEQIYNGIGAGALPAFTADINAANWRITCANGDDGGGKNNEILWRGEAKVTVTAL